MHAGQSQGGWSNVGRCRSTYRLRGDILMTPDHTSSQYAALGRVESKLFGLFCKALTRDATRRLRFVVHAAGWQHSMDAGVAAAYLICTLMLFCGTIGVYCSFVALSTSTGPASNPCSCALPHTIITVTLTTLFALTTPKFAASLHIFHGTHVPTFLCLPSIQWTLPYNNTCNTTIVDT